MQREVDRGLLGDLQHHVPLLGRAKTCGIRLNRVNGGAQPGQDVLAMTITVRRDGNTGGVVRDDKGRPGNHGAALVRHHSANLCCVTGLAPNRCRGQKSHQRDAHRQTPTPHIDTHRSLQGGAFTLLRVNTITFDLSPSQVKSDGKAETTLGTGTDQHLPQPPLRILIVLLLLRDEKWMVTTSAWPLVNRSARHDPWLFYVSDWHRVGRR